MVALPNGVLIDNLIEDLKNYSWDAADVLLNYSKKIKNLSDKSEFLKSLDLNDPVTEADLKVNERMINNIQENYCDMDFEILSEENVKQESETAVKKSDWLWILDPLDGTKDFIQRTGNYAMHLALNYKKKAYIGIVLIPERDELWISDGEKTWCESRNNSVKRFKFSNPNSLQDMIIVTSKNHRNDNLKKLIKEINFKKAIVMGSVGCKISSILRGESDIYISISLPGESSPKDWDFAAPEAILKAAGGAITNIDNEDLSYGGLNYEKGGIIVATNNRKTHKDICLEVKEIIKKYNLYPLES